MSVTDVKERCRLPLTHLARAGARRRPILAALVGLLVAGGCGTTTAPKPPASTTTTTAPATTTTTTAAGPQTSGPRTVLSPVGLNVRAQPQPKAKILGTAARGSVLAVVSYTAASGGWFQVKGATVTGWITADPTLSAAGEFRSYSSAQHQFDALYPAGWTASEAPPASVEFRSSSSPEVVVATTAAKVSALPAGRGGYGRLSSQQILVCGVTTDLVTYQRSGTAPATTAPATTAAASTTPGSTASTTAAAGSSSPPALPDLTYLAQVRLTLDATHALGFTAALGDTGPQLQQFRQFLSSVTFPFPHCTG